MAFRHNVQGSSSDSSDNFFPNFCTHHITYETRIKALISERARRDTTEYSTGTKIEFLKLEFD
jgi:hypothetical protein